MSDLSVPLAALAQFHREVIVPDIERIVGASERRLRDEMHTLHDFTLTTLGRLEFEYQALKSGLARVEGRLQGMEQRLKDIEQGLRGIEQRLHGTEQGLEGTEQRLDLLMVEYRDLVSAVHRLDERLSRVEKRLEERMSGPPEYPALAEVQELRTRVEGLQAQVDALEKRLEP